MSAKRYGFTTANPLVLWNRRRYCFRDSNDVLNWYCLPKDLAMDRVTSWCDLEAMLLRSEVLRTEQKEYLVEDDDDGSAEVHDSSPGS